mmetsp:Transcript_2805/g.5184  ORF Transcript_2805/g.5184 Transcript_2805/m.5184 type:complete len:84 (+) Transcript_2805:535-786(+)
MNSLARPLSRGFPLSLYLLLVRSPNLSPSLCKPTGLAANVHLACEGTADGYRLCANTSSYDSPRYRSVTHGIKFLPSLSLISS